MLGKNYQKEILLLDRARKYAAEATFTEDLKERFFFWQALYKFSQRISFSKTNSSFY